MTSKTGRRQFLHATLTGSIAGATGLGFLGKLRPVSGQEARLEPQRVQFSPEIEPLVRLIEDTPRDALIEAIAGRIQGGLPYRRLLAALLLAGVRNIQPRPSVGFKFHAVLVVNSAHLASLSAPDEDRWLPLLWALDYFKSSQARDVQEGDWTMRPVAESGVPSAVNAKRAFIDAMDRWDPAAADAAVVALARTATANEIFELLFRYGARDTRSIGHKAIFVANSCRALQCIGWQFAEPVLRSLAYALLNHHGEPNPATSDLDADAPWRYHETIVGEIRDDWQNGQPDSAATQALLETAREASSEQLMQTAVERINRGASPQAIWDAVFLTAGELLMRQPGIIALHALTTTNALRFAYQTTASGDTRKRMLLQNLAFVTYFRDRLSGRGPVAEHRIDQLQPEDTGDRPSLPAVFGQLHSQQLASAGRALAFLEGGGRATELIDQARRLVFVKGSDSHDYKFSSAVLEDYFHVSPPFRDRFLAASTFKLHGLDEADNALIPRIRAALS